MPRGPAPLWKQRKEPITDQYIIASVQGGRDNTTGHYRELLYTGIEDKERADEIRRSLFRCARYLGYSMKAEIEKAADGTFQIRFKAIDKDAARLWVIQRYGPDPASWPYDPRRKKESK